MKSMLTINIPIEISKINIIEINKKKDIRASIYINKIDMMLKRLIINSENNYYYKYKIRYNKRHNNHFLFLVDIYDMNTHKLLFTYPVYQFMNRDNIENIDIRTNNELMEINLIL